jgi:hypothetical protein
MHVTQLCQAVVAFFLSLSDFSCILCGDDDIVNPSYHTSK